jgi:hypothetical protein
MMEMSSVGIGEEMLPGKRRVMRLIVAAVRWAAELLAIARKAGWWEV